MDITKTSDKIITASHNQGISCIKREGKPYLINAKPEHANNKLTSCLHYNFSDKRNVDNKQKIAFFKELKHFRMYHKY